MSAYGQTVDCRKPGFTGERKGTVGGRIVIGTLNAWNNSTKNNFINHNVLMKNKYIFKNKIKSQSRKII